jgi:hypothetical protein
MYATKQRNLNLVIPALHHQSNVKQERKYRFASKADNTVNEGWGVRVVDELQDAPYNFLSHWNKAVGSRHCAAVCCTLCTLCRVRSDFSYPVSSLTERNALVGQTRTYRVGREVWIPASPQCFHGNTPLHPVSIPLLCTKVQPYVHAPVMFHGDYQSQDPISTVSQRERGGGGSEGSIVHLCRT